MFLYIHPYVHIYVYAYVLCVYTRRLLFVCVFMGMRKLVYASLCVCERVCMFMCINPSCLYAYVGVCLCQCKCF